jgi:hypothetical protein
MKQKIIKIQQNLKYRAGRKRKFRKPRFAVFTSSYNDDS